jgi:hypothetical protein
MNLYSVASSIEETLQLLETAASSSHMFATDNGREKT